MGCKEFYDNHTKLKKGTSKLKNYEWVVKFCDRGRLNRKKLTSTLTNLTSKTVTSNLTSKTVTSTVKRGVKRGHSIPYHHQQSPPTPRGTPFDPVLLSMLLFSKLNSMLPSLCFRFNKPQSFSIFPYSMLNAFPNFVTSFLFNPRGDE